MFIKRTSKTVGEKKYVNHLLVESVSTPKGPRHNIICSLGPLAPAPKEHWLELARKIESALSGQPSLLESEQDQQIDEIIDKIKAMRSSQMEETGVGDKIKSKKPPVSAATPPDEIVRVDISGVDVEDCGEAGPQHVAHQMWKKLRMDEVLSGAGLKEQDRVLTEIMVINRLVKPSSEHAMTEWLKRTALPDILETDCSELNDDQLYRNLDKLHPRREEIERLLVARERCLFNLTETIYLYDLTSTYFEGQCKLNPKAARGYSRDKRGDCKQVVVGLVIDDEGFPKAHEVFKGNRTDRTTVKDMLELLEKRTGKRPGSTVIVDRGMAFEDTLKQITDMGHHYIVAERQSERREHHDEFVNKEGWQEVVRTPSPTNPYQKKSKVEVKQIKSGEEVLILCKSEGRKQKDKAIREKQDKALAEDVEKLDKRITKGRLVNEEKINQAIGRLSERYPRVGRYYQISYDSAQKKLICKEDQAKKEEAEELDGGYIIKTDRNDLVGDELWRTYMLLTKVESAFKDMKSPLMERPIFHQLEKRVESHIFLCVLALHLLVSIERMFVGKGNLSWETIRERLSTHRVVNILLQSVTKDSTKGDILRIRKGTKPDNQVKQIYDTLEITHQVVKETRTWMPLES